MFVLSFSGRRVRLRGALLAGAALAVLGAGPVLAQDVMATAPTGQQAPMVSRPDAPIDGSRLLELLVLKGTLTREEADSLRSQAAAPLTVPAPVAGAQRVTHIPAPLRAEITEQLRAEVTAQARSEGWAQPGALPEWTQRLTFSGDVRVRGEGAFYGDNCCDTLGQPFPFPDFTAINNSGGFDTNGTLSAPFLNVDEDRTRARVRARLGVTADIAPGLIAGLRVATGQSRSPVSTNQTLGADGSGLYDIWIDRAFVSVRPLDGLQVDLGRFENPFWTTTNLFDDDLNFDGVAARYERRLSDTLQGFGAAGAIPFYNTEFDAPSTETDKSESRDRYLLAAQAGARWTPSDDLRVTGSVGYFAFQDIEGQFSSPCLAPLSGEGCDTDVSRTPFSQNGNAMFAIRNIIPDPDRPTNTALFQYYGVATGFDVLALRGQVEVNHFASLPVRLEAEYLRNLSWDKDEIIARGPLTALGENGVYDGGDRAVMANLLLGTPRPAARGQWFVSAGYRYIESDSVPDAFNDSDFHLGGTNAQGFVVGAGLGVAPRTAVSLRWLSANEIVGLPYEVDVFQLDLDVAF